MGWYDNTKHLTLSGGCLGWEFSITVRRKWSRGDVGCVSIPTPQAGVLLSGVTQSMREKLLQETYHHSRKK